MQKTAIFTGINKVIQSILPSLSTCHLRFIQNTRRSIISQQKINRWFPPFARVRNSRRARRASRAPKSQIPRKVVFFIGVWEFCTHRAIPGAQLSTGYPQLNVDNYCGVWELEGLPRNYYKCANPLTLNALAVQRCSWRAVQILSLLVQPLPQLVLRFWPL